VSPEITVSTSEEDCASGGGDEPVEGCGWDWRMTKVKVKISSSSLLSFSKKFGGPLELTLSGSYVAGVSGGVEGYGARHGI
jgi:hypothetical protein